MYFPSVGEYVVYNNEALGKCVSGMDCGVLIRLFLTGKEVWTSREYLDKYTGERPRTHKEEIGLIKKNKLESL